MQRAPWWPELIRVKDTMTWVELAARFQVHPATLRLAMQRAGVEKVSMPRGPKAKAALSEGVRVLQTEAGRRPDAEVAIAAGMSVEEVKAWRRERGIPPFLRPPPGKSEGLIRGGAPAVATGSPTVIRRRPAGEGEPAEEIRVPAPPAPSPTIRPRPTVWQGSAPPPARPVRPVEPAPPSSAAPSSAERIEAHRADLGMVPDQEIADRIGVSRGLVGNYRRQLGIPPYDGHKLTPFGRVSPSPESPAEEPVAAAMEPVAAVAEAPAFTEPAAPEAAPAAVVAPEPTDEAPAAEPMVETPPMELTVEVPVDPEAEPPRVELPVDAVVEPPAAALPAVTAPAAPLPLPSPAPVQPNATTSPLAFRIKAKAGESERRFVIVSATMGEALARAEVALAARADGPWHVMGIRELSEALS